MCRLIQRLLLAASIYLLVNGGTADALITIRTPNDTEITYPTSDYFMYHQPYYYYSGVSLYWPWNKAAGSCSMEHGSKINEYSGNVTQSLRTYSTLSITVSNVDAVMSGCITLAQVSASAGTADIAYTVWQVGLAVKALSRQLVELQYPPIKLFVFMDSLSLVTKQEELPWAPFSPWFRTTRPESASDGPPAVDVALLDKDAARYLTSIYSVGAVLKVDIEQEAGPWNDIYLSPGYTAYKWILFALVICALLYAYARLFKLIQLWILPERIELAMFAFASITAICALDASPIVPLIVCTSRSFCCSAFFPKKVIICFRAAVLLDLAMQTTLFVIYTLLYSSTIEYVEHSFISFMFDYFHMATDMLQCASRLVRMLPVQAAAAPGGIPALPEACAIYTAIIIKDAISLYKEKRGILVSYNGMLGFSVLDEILAFIQVPVYLSILGVAWPRKPKKNIDAPHSPMD
ncbi:hypothetical protein SYNPS1DRAFT_28688 [Syncephalis pseudoplumigaleata]|uniref:Lung seven transmembrane receptor-domain-containing protein n=1 Tax=Syncephalis pseudoplumigaleata TaxID=1712513 RepID=A0A4P9YZI6_9FUNG|nr:hypothetical protein SYNPS1DRAFT_28688 [Syncephalis pseudoplumigaleata]|eukprot:RKP25577.1 hypothetical protein SYNPS1DRAFT_28688 [Syncephalis pseudoplumigaleata]